VFFRTRGAVIFGLVLLFVIAMAGARDDTSSLLAIWLHRLRAVWWLAILVLCLWFLFAHTDED
jgi:hypothetical protein